MLWRQLENNTEKNHSLILESRKINDASPAEAIRRIEESFGDITGQSIALMGTAYRFNSEDTRNSPTLPLARQLLEKGCSVAMHDPYVKQGDQNLIKFNLQNHFTRDMQDALEKADLAIFCTAHHRYSEDRKTMLQLAPQLKRVFDGCNLYKKSDFNGNQIEYAGIGRGTTAPEPDFIDFVHDGFRIMETGVANEIQAFVDFANERYAKDDFNRVDFKEVQRIAGTCVTGCDIVDPGPVESIPEYKGFVPRLVRCAKTAYERQTDE
jgi:hypothetical protein